MRVVGLLALITGCAGEGETEVMPTTVTDPTQPTETNTNTNTNTPTTPPDVDADGDGYAADLDCDDTNDQIFPGAPDLPGDGIDQNCDDVDHCYADADGDGHGSKVASPGTSLDCDGEGEAAAGDDCDDNEPTMWPGNRDWCDTLDNDCDGTPDPHCYTFSSADAQVTDSDNSFPWALTVGDFDHDDVDEVAVSGFLSSMTYLLDGLPAVGSTSVADVAQNRFIGGNALLCFGCSLGSVDLNGDGYEELIIPQSGNDTIYVYDEASAAGAKGYAGPGQATATITGDEDGWMNLYEAATMGDFDDDGEMDLAIPQIADLGGDSGSWTLLSGPFTGAMAVSDAYAVIDAADASVDLGHAGVSGDFNDDGIVDLAVGSKASDETFVFYGPISADLDTSDADVVLTGASSSQAGETLAVGDFNGDDIVDIAVGGSGTGGIVYVKLAPFTTSHDLTVDAEFQLIGGTASDLGHQETTLAVADVDSDGTDDLMATARDAGVGGEVAVMFGRHMDGTFGNVAVADADMLFESTSDRVSPNHVRRADLDDDGSHEIIIAGSSSGAVYVWNGTTIGL